MTPAHLRAVALALPVVVVAAVVLYAIMRHA